MNSNLFHNILNLLQLVVAALVGYDYTQLGVSTETALLIVAGMTFVANALKMVINITRDGVTGLVKAQPPVK